jgi:Mobilization protein NikA
MLQTMEQSAQASGARDHGSLSTGWNAHSSSSASFASLLAALAKPEEEKELPVWNDDALAEDVATLSYERALRAHARYRPSMPEPPPLAAIPLQSMPAAVAGSERKGPGSPHAKGESEPAERALKSASITLRMSRTECEQLHSRAAEAGLTVSAYLRSCAFEVESLRAQVKQAVAQMRPAQSAETPQAEARSWWMRVWPHNSRQSAQA